jgi:hypothetical protein
MKLDLAGYTYTSSHQNDHKASCESTLIPIYQSFAQNILNQSERQYSICMHSSLVVGRHFIINITYQRYPHLCRVITLQYITDEMRLYLHLNHLQSPS